MQEGSTVLGDLHQCISLDRIAHEFAYDWLTLPEVVGYAQYVPHVNNRPQFGLSNILI